VGGVKLFPLNKAVAALIESSPVVRAHLDLEGFAFVKVTRTGPDSCFSADVTNHVLKGEEPACGKMTTKEISDTFWKVPASERWDKVKEK